MNAELLFTSVHTTRPENMLLEVLVYPQKKPCTILSETSESRIHGYGHLSAIQPIHPPERSQLLPCREQPCRHDRSVQCGTVTVPVSARVHACSSPWATGCAPCTGHTAHSVQQPPCVVVPRRLPDLPPAAGRLQGDGVPEGHRGGLAAM